MEPSLHSDGNPAQPPMKGAAEWRFNGAVASQRRKLRRLRSRGIVAVASMEPSLHSDGNTVIAAVELPSGLLQWSRRFTATETGRLVDAGSHRLEASMEPSLHSDGNTHRP